MAKILTIVDDISGSHNAAERWAAICDGKKVYLLQIDLVDRNHASMEKAFKDALSRWLVNGEVSVVKVADFPQAIEGSKVAEVIEDVFAEIEAPKPAPKPEPAPEPEPKPAPVARKKRAPYLGAPPKEQRPVSSNGEPFSPYLMKALKRPGITSWWKTNREILQLPPYRSGRCPSVVEDAWDRYKGAPVDADELHPVDLERLTAPSGNTPTPKELFSHGG